MGIRSAGRAGPQDQERKIDMTAFRPTAFLITILRMLVLGAAVGLPLLAYPASADRSATLSECDMRSGSGAGLVIVVGLQRSRG